MKTHEAIAALEALNKIANSDSKTPLKFAYAAARNRRKLNEFVQVYETRRMELVRLYGKKQENGELDVNEQGNVELTDALAFAEGMAELHLHGNDVPDLKLYQVALTDFPADIDLGVMDALMLMVLDTESAKA